jgi:predicted permease
VAPGFLAFLGAHPVKGRLFTDADGVEGSAGVLLLSDGFWRRNFGADPDIVGRSLIVNGDPQTIAGVLPPEFTLGFLSAEAPDIYVPYPMTRDYVLRSAEFASVRRVMTLARIAPGVPTATVKAELATIAQALAAEYPALYTEFGGANFLIDVDPLREAIGAGSRASLFLLLGGVVVVLLIGCVNAAQFLLSQAIEREPEVALRTTLGASRGRLVRQFLAETMVLVVVAATLGVLQAVWLIQAVRSWLPPMLMVGRIELDLAVAGFAAAIAVVTTLVCGLVPALRFSRVHLVSSIHVRRHASSRSRSRQVLVAVQVALSIVLLVQAGLLMRTLQVIQQAQSGFSADGVTAMRLRGMASGPQGPAYAQFVERIAATPGIASVAIASSPLPGRPGTSFTIVGRSDDSATRSRQVTSYQIVSPEYFTVLRIPLREGRTFAAGDTVTTTPVAIVNEELARQYFQGVSPLGQQIRAGAGPRDATMVIVGVVGNVRTIGQADDVPQLYVSYLQQTEANVFVLVRPVTAPLAIDAVKRAIWTVEPRQAVFGIRALDEMVSQSLQGGRVMTRFIGSLAALALAMSMAGVFAVVSYLTTRRIREIALRRAIGAQHGDVIWLLSGQTFLWTLAGLAAGLGGAVLASRALRASVNGLADLDPGIITLTCAGYLVVAGAAMILPALRALRVDPATALRAE